MKIGIIISVVILLLIGGMLLFSGRGSVANPTRLTAPNKLEVQSLPTTLPPLYEPTKASDDATELYELAVDTAFGDASRLVKDPSLDGPADKLVGYLVQAMDAGRVKPGMFDEYVPMAVHATPQYVDDGGVDCILLTKDVTIAWAQKQHAEGREMEAVRALRAMFAFGHRLFTESVRFQNRSIGLTLMQQALLQLNAWRESTALADLPPDAVESWLKAVDTIQQAWQEKFRIILNVKPEVGDTINMARNEKDLSLRIEAVLTLAIVKHNAGTNSNLSAIEDTIEAMKADGNPTIASAAAVAEAFTVDDLRRLR